MLKPALLYKNDLKKKFINILRNPSKYKYLNSDYLELDVDLETHTWNKIQFISYYAGEIIGFMSADITQNCKNKINNVIIICFNNIREFRAIFGMDLMRFMKMLINDYKANKITFVAFDGNPAIDHYKKIVKMVNGRIAAILKEDVALFDGTIVDKYIFEVMVKDIPKYFLK